MLWLVLAVLCNLAIVTLFKASERREHDRVALLAVNYAAACIVAVLLHLSGSNRGTLDVDAGLLLLGVGTGILFLAGYYLLAYSIREAGMGLATSIQKIAVVLPVLASWLIWHEIPTSLQIAGLGLAGAAFFLIALPNYASRAPEDDPLAKRPLWTTGVLGALFLSGGLVDIAMKTFGEVYAPTNSRAMFLLVVFGVAFLAGASIVAIRGVRFGTWPEPAVCGWGVVLGVVNYGSAAFILGAIGELPGPIVFPVSNIAIVGGAAVLGVGFWGERFSKANWAGLAIAAVALALLWA